MSDLPATGADAKPWYQSRTIIGAIVSALSALIGLTGREALPADLQIQAVDLLLSVTGLAGAGLSFWGRLRATRVIR